MPSLAVERQARQIFEELVELPLAARPAALDRLCPPAENSTGLRRLVAELLAADGNTASAGFFAGNLVGAIAAGLEEAAFAGLLGQNIGPYRLEAFLGAGGMGAVYAARRLQDFEQQVAIKLLRPGLPDAAAIARFERERQMLASLDHPQIARLLDGGVTAEGRPYLVMERVSGLPITQHADRRRLGLGARLRLVIAVAAAVAHAHRRLVVHRDIKPSNLLVDAEGQPKLLDFGIAKVLEGNPLGGEPLTTAGLRAFSPGYASPEQVCGQPLGTATDQYSLAAVAFELLVGEPPWPLGAASLAELESRYRDRQTTKLGQVLAGLEATELAARAACRGLEPAAWRRQLGSDLERILAKALDRDPEARYPGVEPFAADLEAWLGGRPVAARRPTWFYRSAKFVRRNPLIAWLGVVSLLLAIGLGLREWRSSRQLAAERDVARAEQQRAEQERGRSRAVALFLVDLFGQADPRQQGGRSLTVEELLARGAAAVDQVPDRDPETRALLLTALAEAQQRLGDLDRAAQLYEQALLARREIKATATAGSSDRNLALAAALDGFGKNERLRGRFAEAETLSRQALEMRREQQAAPEELAESLDNLAEALHELGRLDEAEPAYREALALRRQVFGDQHLLVAEILDHYALLERNRGHFAAAVELYRQVLAIRRSALPADHPEIAETLHLIGVLEHDMGQLAAAEVSLEAALQVLERAYQPPHADLALCLNDLGMLEIDLHHDAAAASHLREALAQRRRLYSGDHPELVQTLGGLGGLLARQGQFAEAGTLLAEALARARRLFGDEHVYVAITRQHLADLLLRSGRAPEALAELDRAIAILAATVGADHPRYWRARAQRARVYCILAEPAKSQLERAAAMAALERLLGENHPDLLAAKAQDCQYGH